MAADALSEIESHIRERVTQTESLPDEEVALERVLGELGPPLRVAQAYSAEMAFDEALVTGGLRAISRALWSIATTTVTGFAAALGLFIGYTTGAAFLVTAALKPIFPNNVGLFVRDGIPISFGAEFPTGPGIEVWGGYWVLPVAALIGLTLLVATHRGARRFLGWWRARSPISSLERLRVDLRY